MAAPGRKPQPAALKLLNGRTADTDSGGRKVEPPPAFVRSAPEPPEWLGEEARAEWVRVVPELDRLKLLKQPTRSSLTSYCETWETFCLATLDIHENGLTRLKVTTRKDGTTVEEYVANPAVTIQRNAQREIRAWATEFGLTPSSETRIKVPEADDAGDELD